MSDPYGLAIGFVETRGLTGAIEAADTMVKTAEVRVVSITKTVPALMTVQVEGDVASVQAAVAAGARAAEKLGQLVASHVIPRPAEGVSDLLSSSGGTTAGKQRLSDMTVLELRALARQIDDFPIQGRAVASANKQQLLEAFDEIGRR